MAGLPHFHGGYGSDPVYKDLFEVILYDDKLNTLEVSELPAIEINKGREFIINFSLSGNTNMPVNTKDLENIKHIACVQFDKTGEVIMQSVYDIEKVYWKTELLHEHEILYYYAECLVSNYDIIKGNIDEYINKRRRNDKINSIIGD